MSKSLNNLQPWGAFFLRLVFGVAMIYHGYYKVIPARRLPRQRLLSPRPPQSLRRLPRPCPTG